MTKAEEIFTQVNQLMEAGSSRPDAFKQVAEQLDIQVNSVRGSYYSFSRGAVGNGKSRTRRRVTQPADALADARASLERSIENISAEIEAAEERARESAAEAKELKDTAEARRQAITESLEALR
jgi:methyl-accepting chemotaxis protein